jgi:hypothetical protein
MIPFISMTLQLVIHGYFRLYRKVVEHICLLKAKENLSDEEEKDMLDYLYTTQYQMGGIVAISLGEFLLQIECKDTYCIANINCMNEALFSLQRIKKLNL